ncbi:MAG: glycosyl transferase, partial [Anaerolineaceae bacterium]|nr:glycosyl transferase [Anaerolineaceae bacterium]
GLFILATKEMIALANHLSKSAEITGYQQTIHEMVAAMDSAGWDGAWFRRAYDDFGRPVGSKECEEGQIFIEPQGICIMAGLGLEDGKAATALTSVAERLVTPHGIVLQQPAFSRDYLYLGEISSYPPGYKENAGIFCHTNPWIMIAETIIGHGDTAHDYYLRINPSAREGISDLHRCEPYVYAQLIAGCDAPTHGEAKNSWLSGTAAYNYVAITQWILGIRPELDGLRIHPVIPSSWNGFEAWRNFRGVNYHLTIRRAGPGNQVSLIVDGNPIQGDLVPIPPEAKKEVTVEIVLE